MCLTLVCNVHCHFMTLQLVHTTIIVHIVHALNVCIINSPLCLNFDIMLNFLSSSCFNFNLPSLSSQTSWLQNALIVCTLCCVANNLSMYVKKKCLFLACNHQIISIHIFYSYVHKFFNVFVQGK